MGFLTLGKILSPEKLIEGVGKGVNKFFDGQGDKAERFTELLKLYEPFKLAQRVLAFMVIGVYLFIHWLTSMVWLATVTVNIFWDSEHDPSDLETIFRWNNDNLLYPVLVIVSFYFAGGVINGAVKRFAKGANDKKK